MAPSQPLPGDFAAPTTSDAAPSATAPEGLAAALALLESFVADRGRIATLDEESAKRLLSACGRLSSPDREASLRLRHERRRVQRQSRDDADRQVLAHTGIRARHRDLRPTFPAPLLSAQTN